MSPGSVLCWLLCIIHASTKGRDFYKILGVTTKATTAEIKKAYREASMKYHPDKNDSPDAGSKFAEIAAAYEVLADDDLRKKYDKYGEEGLNKHDGGDPFDFFDFPMFRRHGHGDQVRKVADTEVQLRVTLKQLYFGDNIEVLHTRQVVCGRLDECLEDRKDCVAPGQKMTYSQMGPGFVVQNQRPDSSCIDRGKALKRGKCSQCPEGIRSVKDVRGTIFLDRGMKTGDPLVLPDAGQQKFGHENGDVVFMVEQIDDARFKRDGDDLRTIIHITLLEALVGFEKQAEHLSGRMLAIVKNSVTHDMELMIIKGEGMPRRKEKSSFGDLYIFFVVQYPKQLSPAQMDNMRLGLHNVSEWKSAPREVPM